MLCIFYHIKKSLCRNNMDSVDTNYLERMDLNLVDFLSLLPKDIGSSNSSEGLSSDQHSALRWRAHSALSLPCSVPKIISTLPQWGATEVLSYRISVQGLVLSQGESQKQNWRLFSPVKMYRQTFIDHPQWWNMELCQRMDLITLIKIKWNIHHIFGTGIFFQV